MSWQMIAPVLSSSLQYMPGTTHTLIGQQDAMQVARATMPSCMPGAQQQHSFVVHWTTDGTWHLQDVTDEHLDPCTTKWAYIHAKRAVWYAFCLMLGLKCVDVMWTGMVMVVWIASWIEMRDAAAHQQGHDSLTANDAGCPTKSEESQSVGNHFPACCTCTHACNPSSNCHIKAQAGSVMRVLRVIGAT